MLLQTMTCCRALGAVAPHGQAGHVTWRDSWVTMQQCLTRPAAAPAVACATDSTAATIQCTTACTGRKRALKKCCRGPVYATWHVGGVLTPCCILTGRTGREIQMKGHMSLVRDVCACRFHPHRGCFTQAHLDVARMTGVMLFAWILMPLAMAPYVFAYNTCHTCLSWT